MAKIKETAIDSEYRVDDNMADLVYYAETASAERRVLSKYHNEAYNYIVKSDNLPLHSNVLKSHLVWMADEPLMPNKQYSFKFATKTVTGSVSNINYQITTDLFLMHLTYHVLLIHILQVHETSLL